MHASGYNLRLRLTLAIAATVGALLLYIPAEAHGVTYHAFFQRFIHPWGNRALTCSILALCVVVIAASFPVLRFGSVGQRIAMGVVCLCPLLILAHYVMWLVHQWTTT